MAARKKTSGNKRGKAAGPATAPAGGRPLWTGQLRLALVTVPVRIYPATRSGARLSFHQVHAPTGRRIHYEKVVRGIGPVRADDIVKGYEVRPDQYVLLTDKELASARIEASRTFDLTRFVDYRDVDPIYFERPYYLMPDEPYAHEAYRVIRDALRASHKIGLGQFVMRGREYIGALKPCGNGLLLETLRYPDEVRQSMDLFSTIGDERTEPELLKMADDLIRSKTGSFDPAQFHDQYTDAIHALIERKLKHVKTAHIEDEETEAPASAQIIDLVEALRRSVKTKPAREPPARSRGSRAAH